MTTHKAKFTDGPWSLRIAASGYRPWLVEAKGRAIAAAHTEGIARLICAAPDLYEALNELLEVAETDERDLQDREYEAFRADAVCRARAALAKAEGTQ